MCLPKGVCSKDDCGKLKSKDSNHTRLSKQNTYHLVNKNIAPSKVTDGWRRKRGCLPGHPQAYAFGYSWISWGALGIPNLRLLDIPEYLWVPWASPSLGFCHSLFHSPSNLYPKLENFTTQNSTENLMSFVSERKQNTTSKNCNELIIYLYWC